MRRPDLLVLVAVWEFITALGALIVISAIALFVFPGVGGMHGVAWMWSMAPLASIFGFSVMMLVLICYLGLAIAGGVGLLKGKEWGRVAGIAHAAVSLLWIPVGTIIGILVIVYLIKSDVVEYFASHG